MVILDNLGWYFHVNNIFIRQRHVLHTSILPELKHVNSPYPDYVPEQCFTEFPKGKKNDTY
jgi:hypothetical protein